MKRLARQVKGFATPGFAPDAISRREALADSLFLAGATVLSLVLYVGGLGFYYDDYSFLGLMSTSRDRSLAGLFDAVSAGVPQSHLRPVQEVILSGLYWLFGSEPLPYHLVNAFVLVAMVVLFYLVLRELAVPRIYSVTAPLVFAVLPHYSSDRFWYSAFQAPVSIALYFLSLYAALRSVHGRWLSLGAWITLSIASFVGSVLAYEVALPLFLLTPLLVLYRSRQRRLWPQVAVVVGTYGLGFLAGLAWKIVATRQIGNVSSYHLGYEDGFAHHTAYLISGIAKVNIGTYGIAVPYVIGWILANRFSWTILLGAVVLGALTFGYLSHILRSRRLPGRAGARALLFWGAVVFFLGYAIFLTNSNVLFRSAGIDNRVNIAAAIGVALAFVGATASLAQLRTSRAGTLAFRSTIALICAAGFLVVNTLAVYWTTAWDRQRAIVAALESDLPAKPSGTKLILNGSCPELGPAVVFATTTDLAGALMMRYDDPTIDASVVRDHLQIGRHGVTIVNSFLGNVSSVIDFEYGPKLVLYDHAKRTLYTLHSARDGAGYAAAGPTHLSCPELRSFAWGFKLSRWWPFA